MQVRWTAGIDLKLRTGRKLPVGMEMVKRQVEGAKRQDARYGCRERAPY